MGFPGPMFFPEEKPIFAIETNVAFCEIGS
jgi:hypothetical protein